MKCLNCPHYSITRQWCNKHLLYTGKYNWCKVSTIVLLLLLVSCNNYIVTEEPENITSTEQIGLSNIDKCYEYHLSKGDYDNISETVGFCYWEGTRCAKSGGGQIVSVVFKDKSYNTFIIEPNTLDRPINACGLDNEFTTDRVETKGLKEFNGQIKYF